MAERQDINGSTNDSCTNLYDHRTTAQLLLPLCYSIVFFVGLFGNTLALHVIRPNLKNLNSTTLYSTNLVVSDIIFALVLPLRILYYAMGFHWPLGEGLCRATSLIFYINTYAGVNFMACLSVDRLVAMVLPLRYSFLRSVRTVRNICIAVWLLVLLQTLPLLSMPMTNQESDGYITCMEYPNFEKVDNLPSLLIAAVILGYGIPVVIIMTCYIVLSWKLHVSARNNQVMEKSRRHKKAIGIICGVTLVFVVCFSPYHIDILQYMTRKLLYKPDCTELQSFQVSLHVTVCLMNLNSCLDPFIYFFACSGYKKRIMRIIKRPVSLSFTSATKSSPDICSRDPAESTKTQLNTLRRNP
ncbi:G-protein coupled receptor 183-like [Paramormyrops kingsleyae]|uniref:G-protein coupled receptor 183-like n=1 Tax=Paramormyrops kingsleyae TaxID=1676925 RepID=UPI003B96F853